MLGFAILLAFQAIGYLLEHWAHIPLPANVIGLVLFTLALFAGVIKLEWVEQSAIFLLRHLMLFFAPIIVGTMVYFTVIRENWLIIAVSLLASSVVVMLVSGKLASWMEKQEEGGSYRNEHE